MNQNEFKARISDSLSLLYLVLARTAKKKQKQHFQSLQGQKSCCSHSWRSVTQCNCFQHISSNMSLTLRLVVHKQEKSKKRNNKRLISGLRVYYVFIFIRIFAVFPEKLTRMLKTALRLRKKKNSVSVPFHLDSHKKLMGYTVGREPSLVFVQSC